MCITQEGSHTIFVFPSSCRNGRHLVNEESFHFWLSLHTPPYHITPQLNGLDYCILPRGGYSSSLQSGGGHASPGRPTTRKIFGCCCFRQSLVFPTFLILWLKLCIGVVPGKGPRNSRNGPPPKFSSIWWTDSERMKSEECFSSADLSLVFEFFLIAIKTFEKMSIRTMQDP